MCDRFKDRKQSSENRIEYTYRKKVPSVFKELMNQENQKEK